MRSHSDLIAKIITCFVNFQRFYLIRYADKPLYELGLIHFTELVISRKWITARYIFRLSLVNFLSICIDLTCTSSGVSTFDKRILSTVFLEKRFTALWL